jgi:hypothetical protein
MLEPVSVVGLGIAAIYALARPGNAMSAEASLVQASAKAIVERVEHSDALFGSKAAVISELWSLAQSHGNASWDGGEAFPVDRRAMALAVVFVRAQPDDCEMPQVAVDPDGAVNLDWMPSRHRMLSVSFAGNNDRVAYAWIDGTDRGSAVARFDRRTVPMRLLQAILAVTEVPDDVALWAA